eukprot:Phypoly_transcript_18665.p1 GENE.Phypoly_transcript_18665~~Phypoly_transcript_18665.p1  ORF type:complete len:245 (+),score=38.18 Phypoly_transcript_18665:45-737(+)
MSGEDETTFHTVEPRKNTGLAKFKYKRTEIDMHGEQEEMLRMVGGGEGWRFHLSTEDRNAIVHEIAMAMQESAVGSNQPWDDLAAQCEDSIYQNSSKKDQYFAAIEGKILQLKAQIPTNDTPIEYQGELPVDWCTQLRSEDRQIMVQKIIMVLQDCVIDPRNLDESKFLILANKFEESVFQNAPNRSAYFNDIAKKMYHLKAKSNSTNRNREQQPLPPPSLFFPQPNLCK